MKTIAILNSKGGVGKTTTADNLAVGLTKNNKKVLLVDLDPQANSTDIFYKRTEFEFEKFIDAKLAIENYTLNDLAEDFDKELENEFDISKALLNPTNGKEAILKTDFPRLDLLPASMALANTDVAIRNEVSSPQHNRLLKILNSVSIEYDYCIIDCPPITNVLTLNALVACNELIIPIKIDRGAAKGFLFTIINVYDTIQNFGINISVKILFTMVNRNNIDKKFIELIRRVCIGKVFTTTIRNQSKAITASSFNEKVVIQDDSKVSKDYQQLIEEILEVN